MNAEALTHAAKACRESADFLTRAADDADVFLHRCPDAGAGMRQVSNEMRARAIGLKVAAAFLDRCARFPLLLALLGALETGRDVVVLPLSGPVVVGDDQDPAATPRWKRARAVLARFTFARAA